MRSWWQQIKRPLSAIGIIAVSVLLVALIVVEVRFYGTGFAGKTLWDWLQLISALAIPVVVGFGAVWFTTRQGKVADAENTDNQRETALQAYIDKMSELLLKEHLGELTEDGELNREYEQVRNIARVRTLTVLRGLDGVRKGSVLQFLQESSLIGEDKRIIDLTGADLSGATLTNAKLGKANLDVADLSNAKLIFANLNDAHVVGAILRDADLYHAFLKGATLEGTNLSGANLTKANLTNANLGGVNLTKANLTKANLSGANLWAVLLWGANLSQANVTEEQLKEALSLKGATMPDGSIHP